MKPVTSTGKAATSLKELGFKIEPIKGKDAHGNEWIFRARGVAPTFLLKKTKRGKIRAYLTKNSKIDTTIHGLYDFKEKDGDIVGKRLTQASPVSAKRVPIEMKKPAGKAA